MAKFWHRWIADYQAKTIGLSMRDDGAYARLLDYYYLIEGPIPADLDIIYAACRAIRAEDRQAVDKMLAKFFTLENEYYRQPRCDQELTKTLQYQADQSRRGRMGAQAAWSNRKHTVHKGNKEDKPVITLPDWIPLETWNAYRAMRQRIRRPMTDHAIGLAVSALDKLRAEGNDPQAVLERSILNSWQGLFALKQERNGADLHSRNQAASKEAIRRMNEEQNADK